MSAQKVGRSAITKSRHEGLVRLSASQLRTQVSDTLDRVFHHKDRIVLVRSGKEEAAIVPLEDLELLETLEDEIDLRDVKKVLSDPEAGERISWEQVKSELGL